MSADPKSDSRRAEARDPAGPARLRARPAYDPAAVTPGIVHLGLGGFHRAHMARYTHDLMELDPGAREWGIVGAGLMPGDRRMIDSLAPQDGLYTLVERSGAEETRQRHRLARRRDLRRRVERGAPRRHRRPGHPHRQPDRDGERLLPRPGDEAARPRAPADPRRPRRAGASQERGRDHRRGAAPPPRRPGGRPSPR